MAATTRIGGRGIRAHRPLRPGGIATALIVAGALLAGCSTEGADETRSLSTTSGGAVGTASTTSATPTPSAAPTPALDTGPFSGDDLEDLVLRADEGEGLVDGLSYSASYSGSADLGDVHHWTLVPTGPLETAGFIEAYSGMFMTPPFPGTFAREGRSLATAVLLFRDPEGARRGLRTFRTTRAETWDVWEPLTMRGGFGTIGRLGSDNVSVVYPTVGFMGRVGNVIVMAGSQGGSDGSSRADAPLPVPMVRGIALGLLARAWASIGGRRGSLATCPEGSNPDQPGLADQARPGKGGGPMAFDRNSGRIVLVETGYGPSSPEVETWTFDVCANTWVRMEPAMEPPSEVRKLVYDEDADLTVAFGGTASGWTYDVETNTWSKGRVPVSIQAVQAAHDPVTGLTVVRDGWTGSMYSFDAGTGTWADVEQGAVRPPTTDGPMHGQVMAYDPTVDRLVLFVEGHNCCPATWLFDLRSGTWTETDAETPTIEFVMGDLVNGDEIVFDEAAGRIVVMSGDQQHIFEGSTLTWESLPSGLDRAFGVRLVYDAVNQRLVLNDPRVWSDGEWRQTRRVLAFEPFAGGWIELVPPLGVD